MVLQTPGTNIKMIILDSNFVLGNAVAPPDYPIVYCSDGFCELTGILSEELLFAYLI